MEFCVKLFHVNCSSAFEVIMVYGQLSQYAVIVTSLKCCIVLLITVWIV